MARDLSTGFEAEIQERIKSAAFFVELELDTVTLRLWTGIGTKSFDGNTYTGAGGVLNFSEIRETQIVQANGISVSLTGLQTSLLSVALQEDVQGRPLRIWFALFDEGGSPNIVYSYLVFSGKADVFEIEATGDTCTMRLTAETELIDLLKPRERNLTPEDQKKEYPTDKGLDFIPFIQDAEIVWGPKG